MIRPLLLPVSILVLATGPLPAQETPSASISDAGRQGVIEDCPDPVALEIMSDGLALQGRFYRAGAPAAGKTLLLLPGLPGNPEDVLGLGRRLSGRGINVLMLTPRGIHGSEGTFSFEGAMKDIGAAWRWLRSDTAVRRFGVDRDRVAMGGYSWGGGMALAYAAGDTTVRQVLSIAGTDHGELYRMMQRNPAVDNRVRAVLSSFTSAEGPVRGDVQSMHEELSVGQERYGLRENAVDLADREILLIGGWQDRNVTMDDLMLPLYRALESEGADQVRFVVYHDSHAFRDVREELADDIASWLEGTTPAPRVRP